MRSAARIFAFTFAFLALTAIAATPAGAAEPSGKTPTAVFALVVGVNRSVDSQLAALSYADDDAFRYRDLFLSVGARTLLLTRPDENTRRINSAVAEAGEPVERALLEAVATLAGEVSAARAQGRRVVFYFVYAGHGNLGEKGAYLTLEDQRLTGSDLDRRVLRPIAADETHLIVDACYSYFLAHERGPGGRAREVRGFSRLGELIDREDVGLLLSTSSARESHEWQDFQAGVFSHEVRSGLYGAADANGDGEVSYREIAAFVAWANAAIPNERFRPEVFARPPHGQSRLLDLRAGLANRITIDPQVEPGHHVVEDQHGNRVAEFHNPRGQTVQLMQPARTDLLFVRHVVSGREYEVRPRAGELRLGELPPRVAPLRARGAAHHAFSRIFSLPFDRWVVEQFEIEPEVGVRKNSDGVKGRAPTDWRRTAAIGALGVALLSGVTAGWLVRSTRSLEEEAGAVDQRRAAQLNQRIEIRRGQALAAGIASGATALAGTLFWLWLPAARPMIQAEPGRPVVLGWSGPF